MTKPVLRKGENGEDLITVTRNKSNSAESDPGTVDFVTYEVFERKDDMYVIDFRRVGGGCDTSIKKTVARTSELYKYLLQQYESLI